MIQNTAWFFFFKSFFFFSPYAFFSINHLLRQVWIICMPNPFCIKNGLKATWKAGRTLSGRIVLTYAPRAVYTESLTLKMWFGDFHNSWCFFNLQISVQRLTMTTASLKGTSPIHARTMYDQSLSTIVLCLYNISHIFYSDMYPDLVYNLWALASLLRKKIGIWTLSGDLRLPELPKPSYSAKQSSFTLFMCGWYYTLQRTQCLW